MRYVIPMNEVFAGQPSVMWRTAGFLKSRSFPDLSADDRAFLENSMTEERSLRDHETLVERGVKTTSASLLIEGFMLRTIVRGNRRHILGVYVPGDFVDLHGFTLGHLDHNVVAAGTARVGMIPYSTINYIMTERPSLAQALWFATLLDGVIARKWIQMFEELNAPQRIAHVFCELKARLELIGCPVSYALRTPFTLEDVADMCGISAVHASRAASKLRSLELGSIRRGTFYPTDWNLVHSYARFDPSYLYGDGTMQHPMVRRST